MQVVDPNLIIQKQTFKEWMNRDPKPFLKEILEHNNLPRPWVRKPFSFRCSPSSKLLVVEYSHVDEFIDGLCGGFGFPLLLGHHLHFLLRVAFGHLG